MFKAALKDWVRSILVVSLLAIGPRVFAQVGCATLNWTASTDTNVVGYKVYYGVETRVYTNSIDEGDVTNATVCGLITGTTYYFAVTAYDSFGLESDYSNEIVYTVPATNGTATVTLTSPASGAFYSAPATVPFAATVTTNGQSINGVRYYSGTTLVGSNSVAPYTFNWTGVGAGTYTLAAVLVFDSGYFSTSAPVSITVTNPPPPAVALTSPVNGANYASPATIPFAANVTANGNPITSVEYFNGATQVGSATTAPYAFNWTSVAAGAYSVHALVVYGTNSLASTAVSVTVTNPPPTVALTSPANGAAYAAPATIDVAANVTANGNSISGVQFYNGAALLGTASSAPYTFTWSNVSTGSYTLHALALYGSGSSVASSTATISVQIPPVISVISNQATLVNTPTTPIGFTVSDVETAASNILVTAASGTPGVVAVTNIVFSGGGSNRFVTITPTTNQTGIVTITLTAAYGGVSASTAFELEIATTSQRPPAPTFISVTGVGTVTPQLDPDSMVTNESYTVTAVPGPGQQFLQWSGSVTSTTPTITFKYEAGFTLTANFGPAQYVLTPGTYTGLFYETNAVAAVSAGTFSLVVSKHGTYTGHVRIGAHRYAFSGLLNGLGHGANSLARAVSTALSLSLQMGAGSQANQVFGSLSDGSWIASLIGDRSVYNARTNAAPDAGTYTLIFPGEDATSLVPNGDGFGSVHVGPAGVVLFAGRLADGVVVSQGATVASDGTWPLYLSLYAGNGLLTGWMDFTNEVASDLSGQLTWTRPANSAAHYYPAGFTNQFLAAGSVYTPPAYRGGEILTLTNGTVTLSGGDVAAAFTNSISLGGLDHATDLSSNPLTLTFLPGRGLFTGHVQDPATGDILPFSGAVFQKLETGYGMHLGADQSSQVVITP